MFRQFLQKLFRLSQKSSFDESLSEEELNKQFDMEWRREENQMPEYKGDGKECPFCKSTNVRTFIYGLTRFNSEEEEKETLKTNVMGGCSINPQSPKYSCDNCDKAFGAFQ